MMMLLLREHPLKKSIKSIPSLIEGKKKGCEVKNQFKKNRNQVKAYVIVQSHLSDMLYEIDYGLNSILKENTTTRIGFIEYLIQELEGNLDQYIDPNAIFVEYRTKFVNS